MRSTASGRGIVISQGYVALKPVDVRMGYERLGGPVREHTRASRAARRYSCSWGNVATMKVLTRAGTGFIVMHEKLDARKFELSKAARGGDQHTS
jgi:hypothetical protein